MIPAVLPALNAAADLFSESSALINSVNATVPDGVNLLRESLDILQTFKTPAKNILDQVYQTSLQFNLTKKASDEFEKVLACLNCDNDDWSIDLFDSNSITTTTAPIHKKLAGQQHPPQELFSA